MKCAVLCNGPSRVAYIPSPEYEWVVGCNIPWAKVDATVIVDTAVVKKWKTNLNLISVPTYFSNEAWNHTKQGKKQDIFEKCCVDVFKTSRPPSSGHSAAEIAIKKGYTEIDIFGADIVFSNDTKSYTREHISQRDPSLNHAIRWRKRWRELQIENPNVTFTFFKADRSTINAPLEDADVNISRPVRKIIPQRAPIRRMGRRP